MVDATRFFAHPARDICSIYSQVFGIFKDHFKTLALLALFQALALIPVVLVFGFLVAGILLSQQGNVANAMNTDDDLFGATYSGGSWNSQGSEWSDQQSTLDTSQLASLGMSMVSSAFEVFGLFIAYSAAVICISAIFQAAFIRAVSEVFAGHEPNWKACLRAGREKMLPIICFNIICLIVFVATYILWFFATIYPQLGNPHFGLIFLSFVIFVLALIVFATGMRAGLSLIVIENKSPVTAITRSWDLCKSKIGFIFCCAFCFYTVEIICQMIISSLLTAISTSNSGLAVSVAARWIMWLLLGPLNATLNPTIYFSLRIQKEGLSMEQLQGDLSLFDGSIELQNGASIFSGVPAREDPSLMPIAKATAV